MLTIIEVTVTMGACMDSYRVTVYSAPPPFISAHIYIVVLVKEDLTASLAIHKQSI